jgi:hypothetical protein
MPSKLLKPKERYSEDGTENDVEQWANHFVHDVLGSAFASKGEDAAQGI